MRARRWAWLLLLGASACREPLCVQTLHATCACDDPLQPQLLACVAALEVSGCDPVDAAVDPCVLAPCCRLRTDGGSAADAGSADGGASLDLRAVDGSAAQDQAVPDGAAPEDLGSTDGGAARDQALPAGGGARDQGVPDGGAP